MSKQRRPHHLGPGITPKQAHYLAVLQRALGERYTGDGMSRLAATEAISDCIARLAASGRGREVALSSRRPG